jgi:Kre9/KNH-like N-terminal Ig-like domain
MKTKTVIQLILFIVLSFLSLSFAVERVQVKPGVVQTKPIQVTPVELPDLLVDSIWLDNQCNINFRLKNSGKGNIPDTEHRESVVRIQFGSEIKDLSLARIDPNGALKKAGGLVSFNTQMTLKSSIDVKVIVDFNQKIKETDAGEKHNEKAEKLTPQCVSVAKTDSKAKTLTGEEGQAKKFDAPFQKLSDQKIPTPLKSDAPLQKRTVVKAPVLLSGDTPGGSYGGIKITEPTQNTVINIDFNLGIIWETFGPAANALQFRIELWDPKKGKLAVKITPDTGISFPKKQTSYKYTWTIPTDLPLGLYRVLIKTFDNQYYAFSPDFNVLPSKATIPPGTGIKVTSPKVNQILAMGDNHQIQWKNQKSIAGKDRIGLLDEYGNLIKKIDENATDSGGDNSYGWKVPSDVPKGVYRIKISTYDDKYSGYSGDFIIIDQMVRLTYPPNFYSGVNYTDPKQQTKWDKGKSYTIKWEAYGLGNSKFTINLVDPFGKKPPSQIAVTNPGATSYPWTVPSNTPNGFYLLEVRGAPNIADQGMVCIGEAGMSCAIMQVPKIIKVQSPSKGTVWAVGDIVKIAYEVIGDVGSTVKIYLIPIAFGDFANIYIGSDDSVSYSKVGSCQWKVPSISKGFYKIKVTNYDGKIFGEGEPFEITSSSTKPFVQVTSPSKDAKWFMGSTYSIKWETSGPLDMNSPTMVSLLAPNGLAYSLSIPSVKLGAKSFNWKITSDPTTTQSGQYRIRVSSGEEDAYSEPFTIISSTSQPPNQGTFKIQSIKTWRPGYALDKIGTVEIMVQALTDTDFTIGDYGHPDFGSLYVKCDIINKVAWQDKAGQGYVKEQTAFSGTFSCKGGGASKPLEFPLGLIKAGQTFKVSLKLEPSVADKGVKTDKENIYPEIAIQLFGYTKSGQSIDSKKQAIPGGTLVYLPPAPTITGTQ